MLSMCAIDVCTHLLFVSLSRSSLFSLYAYLYLVSIFLSPSISPLSVSHSSLFLLRPFLSLSLHLPLSSLPPPLSVTIFSVSCSPLPLSPPSYLKTNPFKTALYIQKQTPSTLYFHVKKKRNGSQVLKGPKAISVTLFYLVTLCFSLSLSPLSLSLFCTIGLPSFMASLSLCPYFARSDCHHLWYILSMQLSAKCRSPTGGLRWLSRLRRNSYPFGEDQTRTQDGYRAGPTVTERGILGWTRSTWRMTRLDRRCLLRVATCLF